MMKAEVIEENTKNNTLTIRLEGEDHTLVNALKANLWKSKGVEAAASRIKHPLVDNIELMVRTSGKKSPKSELESAAEKTADQCKEFRKAFEQALKK